MITARQKLTRYGGSLAIVLGIHAVAIIIALNRPVHDPVQAPPLAMTVELAPMLAPSPPAPPPVVTPPKPPEPEEKLPIPKLAEAPKPEKRQETPAEPSEKAPSDTPPTNAPAEKSAAPVAGPTSQQIAAKANWQGSLLAHLAKYKKYPPAALARGKEGTSRLRFVVDAEGKVLSYELVGSAGTADLDRATLDMIRRASPVPKPPAEMLANGTITITAPFTYNIERRR